MKGFDACFFCIGTSAIGKNEAEYSKLTFDLTINFAKTFLEQSQNSVFCYVTGAGTDSTGKGRAMWARVKGKTENTLLNMPFKSSKSDVLQRTFKMDFENIQDIDLLLREAHE